jgi:rare lipoprotein A
MALCTFGFGLASRSINLTIVLVGLLALNACGHKHNVKVQPPGAPTGSSGVSGNLPATPTISIPPHAKPIFVETGIASWYGPLYNNRKAANGEIFDMNQLTAAHRTLPLNSIVRVTNLKTERSALVRINDRGPFVPNRIIDLSAAAAKEVDVWKPGIAKVRLEVFQAPAPLDKGGRWCVQIGGFRKENTARRIEKQLLRRYRTVKVLTFPSPAGDWWVRVRVADDDKHKAESVVKKTRVDEGSVFLVRLD